MKGSPKTFIEFRSEIMRRRIAILAAAGLMILAAMAAAWDAPRTPQRVAEFFSGGERYFLDPFADGYQAVKLDEPTEEALRRARNDPAFDTHVFSVIRRGEDFIHFRSASEETDVIIPAASIRRISFRVQRQFD
jgi:hypothetical protein